MVAESGFSAAWHGERRAGEGMGGFLLVLLSDLLSGTTTRRLAAAEAFGSRPDNPAARRCRIVALCFFMAASSLLLTAALAETLSKARAASEVFGWSGIACLQVCVLCGIRYAVVNKRCWAAVHLRDVAMGIDVLDLVFRLETRFGIQIPRGDWIKLMMKNDPPDIAVGDVFDFVRSRAIASGVVDPEMDADLIWPMFQRDISDSLGVEPDEVVKDRWIIRDLGAT